MIAALVWCCSPRPMISTAWKAPPLAGLPRSDAAEARRSLTMADLGHLPNVLAGTRSAVVVVRTDEGNYARLQVAPALRNPPEGQGDPVPILVVERFDTFEAGPATKRIARGRGLTLFDGFRLDLDSGQVVPEGQGGDLLFSGTAGAATADARADRPGDPVYAQAVAPAAPAPGARGHRSGRIGPPGRFRRHVSACSATARPRAGWIWRSARRARSPAGSARTRPAGPTRSPGTPGKDAPHRVRFAVSTCPGPGWSSTATSSPRARGPSPAPTRSRIGPSASSRSATAAPIVPEGEEILARGTDGIGPGGRVDGGGRRADRREARRRRRPPRPKRSARPRGRRGPVAGRGRRALGRFLNALETAPRGGGDSSIRLAPPTTDDEARGFLLRECERFRIVLLSS